MTTAAPAANEPVPGATPPLTPAASRPVRVLRALAAPFRFARRHPRRAAFLAGLALVLAAGLAVAAVAVWFNYHLSAARREVEAGHNAAALKHLDACHSVDPEHRETLILSARVARRSGSFDEAEAFLTHYGRRYGDADPLVLERLLLRATRGEVEAVAPQLVARAREGGPDARLAREGLITGLVYRFRWGDADRLLAAWLAEAPDDTTALVLRGKLDEQRQQNEAAAKTYRRVVELDPGHDDARLRLTTLLVANRFGEEALTHLTELRRRLPSHPEVALQWARALALQGRTAESRAAVAACLAAHPDYPGALAERGGAALVDGDEAAAERDLGRAARLDPGSMAVRSQYALVLARAGKAAEAAREQAEADTLKADAERVTALIEGPLQARPNDPAVPHEIAQIALRAGQIREALRWYEAALRADPDHLPTHRVLAALHRELENPALAARHRAIAQQLTARQKQ